MISGGFPSPTNTSPKPLIRLAWGRAFSSEATARESTRGLRPRSTDCLGSLCLLGGSRSTTRHDTRHAPPPTPSIDLETARHRGAEPVRLQAQSPVPGGSRSRPLASPAQHALARRRPIPIGLATSRLCAAHRRPSKPQGRTPKPRGLVQRVLCAARPTRRRRLAEGSRSAALPIESSSF